MLKEVGTAHFLTAQIGIVIFNGRVAVTLFFVLSGFVLSLGFNREAPLTLPIYLRFLVRRFFRLMPLLWTAALFSILIGYGSIGKIFSYFLLLDLSFDPVTWTLLLEIAVCLIYPLMLFAVARYDIAVQLVVIAAMVWLFGRIPPSLYYGQCQGTGLPVVAFFLGLSVSTVGRAVIRVLSSHAVFFVPVAVACLMLPEIARWYRDFHEYGFVTPTTQVDLETVTQFACFHLIAWLAYGKRTAAHQFLNSPCPLALGRWSYGIFVLHFPIIYFLLHHMPNIGSAPPRFLLGSGITIAAAVALAAACHRWIEWPANNFGRWLVAAKNRQAAI